METPIKRLKLIKKMSISALALLSIGVVLTIISMIVSVISVNNQSSDVVLVMIFFIIGIILLVPGGVLSLVSSILILATDWKVSSVNENKIIWGLVSLLLLGSIGNLIFCSINNSKINNTNSSNIDIDKNQNVNNEPEKNDDSTKLNNSFDQILKFKELLDAGAITKEEFEKEKEKILNTK